MVTVAEFSISSTEFPLGTILMAQPQATVELERVVPTQSAFIPYFWVRCVDDDLAIESIGSVTGIRDIQLVDEVNDEYLFRVTWEVDAEGIIRAVMETGVSLLSAVGSRNQWVFEIRAEQPGDIRRFQMLCLEYGARVELTSIHSLTPMAKDILTELTEPQEEALILAFRRGYYESPQRTTLNEMAKELGITGQSLGSRLRRGIQQLIENALINPRSTD